MIRESLNRALLGALAVSLLGCSTAADRVGEQDESGEDATSVRTVAVVQQDVQRKSVQPATVHPFYQAEILTKVTGYVSELHVDIGDHVSEGDPLLTVDVPELLKQRQTMAAKVARTKAELNRAEADVQLARANVQAADARLAQSKSMMGGAEASLMAAEAEFTRTNDLVSRQSLERRMLDESRKRRDSELAAKESSASAILSAEADVSVAKARLASAEAGLAAAKSDIEIAQSELEEKDVMVDYTTLKAPFSGVVTQRNVDLGDLVLAEGLDAKGRSLMSLSQLDKLRIHAPVPEAEAAWVAAGDTLSVVFPSFPGETPLEAAIARVSHRLDPSTRTMLVEAVVDNHDMKLLPGMFGQATITLGTAVASNVLPARAVRFNEQGDAYVYVVRPDDTVDVVTVTTGADDGRTIEVTSGVEPGQDVIDAHLNRFVAGQKVSRLPSLP